MASPGNPLAGLAWPGQAGVNQPPPPTANPLQGNLSNQPINPTGDLFGYNRRGTNNPLFDMQQIGINRGLMANSLIPSMSQNFFGMGGQAGNYFGNLVNLGSPYYQQQQAQSFTQGNQQNQNAAAQARQQLQSQGYGSTPSGANAAMIGGMAQGGAQSLSEQFLQNLFNNEQLQLAGAQGLGQLAGMFNPAQLAGSQQNMNYQQNQNNFAQNMEGLGSFLGGMQGFFKPR